MQSGVVCSRRTFQSFSHLPNFHDFSQHDFDTSESQQIIHSFNKQYIVDDFNPNRNHPLTLLDIPIEDLTYNIDDCKWSEIAYIGGDLPDEDGGTGLTVKSNTHCAYECLRRANCQFWTHVQHWNVNCFLKGPSLGASLDHPFNEMRVINGMEGSSSGTRAQSKNCLKALTSKNLPREPAVARKSRNVLATNSLRLGETLIMSEGAREGRQQESGVVLFDNPLDSSGCSLSSVAIMGADLPVTSNGGGVIKRSFIECRTLCRNQRGCFAFTYVTGWRTNCFLKDGTWESSGIRSEFVGAATGTLKSCGEIVSGAGVSAAVPQSPAFGAADFPSAFGNEDSRVSGRPAAGVSLIRNNNPSLSRPSSSPLETLNFGQRNRQNGRLHPTRRPSLQEHTLPINPGRFTTNSVVSSQSENSNSFSSTRGVSEFRPEQHHGLSGDGSDESECEMQDTNFLGGGLSKEDGGQGVIARDVKDCISKCEQNEKCKFWTFVGKWRENCYLKSRIGEVSDYAGGVSGSYGIHCDEIKNGGGSVDELHVDRDVNTAQVAFPSSNPEECRFEETNFLGGGLKKEQGGQGIVVGDVDQCSEECVSRPLCNYWTFVGRWRVNCYLKSKLGEKSTFAGGVSGSYQPYCGSLQSGGGGGSNINQAFSLSSQSGGGNNIFVGSRGKECIFPNSNFLGGGLTREEGGQGIKTSSQEDCSNECKSRPACNYWTFVSKWKVNCYLKSRLGEQAEYESVSGTYGSACEITPGAVYLHGERLESSEASAPSSRNRQHVPEQQPRPSQSNTGPVRTPTKLENLLAKKQNRLIARQNIPDSRPVPFPTSSNTIIKNGIKDGAGCRYTGVNILEGDLEPKEGGHGIETTSADHCRDECAKRTACLYWTHVDLWKVNCYLKEKDNGRRREMKEATSGSLLTACGESSGDELGEIGSKRDSKHECGYKGISFNGADLPAAHGGLGIPKKSAQGCRDACLESVYCYHWTYVAAWTINCYLKSGESAVATKMVEAMSGSIGVRCLAGSIPVNQLSKRSPGISPPGISSENGLLDARDHNTKIIAGTGTTCIYPHVDLQGGDLPNSQGGNGISSSSGGGDDDELGCQAECERRSACVYWSYVVGWKVNCYLKSSYEKSIIRSPMNGEEGDPKVISGSISVPCNPALFQQTASQQPQRTSTSLLPSVLPISFPRDSSNRLVVTTTSAPNRDDSFAASSINKYGPVMSSTAVQPSSTRAAVPYTTRRPPSTISSSGRPPQSSGGSTTKTSVINKNPIPQPDNVCFFHNTVLIGGIDVDISNSRLSVPSKSQSVKNALKVTDSNLCAVECYQRERCLYWIFIHDSSVEYNCFLKASFQTDVRRGGVTSGSIGLTC